jgi:tubulin polyglutamylase TTLL6/13
MSNSYIHLTNYSLNKNNPNFIYNTNENEDDVGHKRSLTSVFATMEEGGVNIDNIWGDIQEIVIKTMCIAQPHLKNN